ncbi:hypothetical protein F6X37_32460 [Paraburkholderia sp. 31.1]|uniref:hypothetical protein n=1 Tax=Paraburkholderia sp. 31.1 TaxID=2615205 RepID=UPI00165550E7|nr:hypothetical protein [Paraburkholderia sp. 31.1]MBC8726082.1 hypothetical protein [Paraburkholderia sp. 31.1]
MGHNTRVPTQDILDRYFAAAVDLAVCIDVMDRGENDPTYPADRSDGAQMYRLAMFTEALETFRAAKDVLLTAMEPREVRRPVDVTDKIEAVES